MRFIVVLSAIGIVGYGLQMFFTNPQNSSVVSGIAILIVFVGLVFMCFGLFGEFDAIMDLGDNHGSHIGGAAIISVIYMYRSMVDKFRNRS